MNEKFFTKIEKQKRSPNDIQKNMKRLKLNSDNDILSIRENINTPEDVLEYTKTGLNFPKI
jgi:hypothetical protein